MKFTAKLFLVALIVPFLLLAIIAASIKFQLLNPKFWLSTFEKHNVYETTATALKEQAEGQVVKGGGNKNDTRILTDLITPENLKDFTEKNITNFLSYANGKSPELKVSLPVKKIPRGLLPKNFANLPEEITLSTLLSKFDIKAVTQGQIQQVSILGPGVTYFLIFDLILTGLFLFFLILLTDSGSRFLAPGISLVLTGLLAFFAGLSAYHPNGVPVASSRSPSLAEILILNTVPPIMKEVMTGWIIIGIALMVGGGVLLVLKKR